MIRNNPDKFPSGYVIKLTNSEKEYVVKNFDHLETLKFSHATVKGFTEQGLYMLATILKSPMATATAIAIIDTFTKLRKLARTIDKVNEDAKEHGIYPDKNTEDKIQTAMNEVFADNLPLKLRKLTFGVNLGGSEIFYRNHKRIQRIKEYKKAALNSESRLFFLIPSQYFSLKLWKLRGKVIS